LGIAKENEAALKRYQILVRNPGDHDETAATLQKLCHQVWKPILQACPPAVNTVTISPDAQLNFLSFATLLDGEKRFVAEKYSLRYVASGRDLLSELKPTQNNQVVLLANPKFDKDVRGNTQTAKTDLSTAGSGVLRGTEKREIQDRAWK
jgi:CHAT domain-containing protein